MKQATVLVIEDNLNIFRLIKTTLTASPGQNGDPYQIIYAPDGISGIEQVWLACPDIILLDIELPDLDGYEVLQLLRSLEIATPVIVMTANAEQSVRYKAFEAGCSAYLAKPFPSSSLRSCIQELLTDESAASDRIAQEMVQAEHLLRGFASAFHRKGG